MSLPTDIQNTVVNLLNDTINFSRTATLRRVTNGAPNVSTGTITQTFKDETTRTMLLEYDDRAIDNETILRGDRRALLVGTLNPIPKFGDRLIVGPDTYEIIAVKKVEMAGTNIVFSAQVRLGA